MNYTQRSIVLDVETYHWDDEEPCVDCGDELEDTQPVVYEPAPEIGPKACWTTHAWCAVKNGYKLRWPK